MANEQNLQPGKYKFTEEDYIKSQASRQENAKRKKNIRMAFEALLEKDFTLDDGTVVSGAEAIALAQFNKALDGNTQAFVEVRDSSGQKPIEKVAFGATDEIKDEMRELLEQRKQRNASGREV